MDLPTGWQAVSPDDAKALEKELARELCSEHILAGAPARCIARREDRDDFLFHVNKDNNDYAVVHLTWSKESAPEWPWTTLFKDSDDFASNWRRIFD